MNKKAKQKQLDKQLKEWNKTKARGEAIMRRKGVVKCVKCKNGTTRSKSKVAVNRRGNLVGRICSTCSP